MMKNRFLSGLIMVASCGSANAGFDGSQPLLCASANVIECLPMEGCHLVAAEAIGAPDFLRIDFSTNTLTSSSTAGGGKSSVIERSDIVDSKLILQGAEDGVEGVRDGIGWTLAIAQDTGKMVLTASGDAVAFTIFGACTTL